MKSRLTSLAAFSSCGVIGQLLDINPWRAAVLMCSVIVATYLSTAPGDKL